MSRVLFFTSMCKSPIDSRKSVLYWSFFFSVILKISASAPAAFAGTVAPVPTAVTCGNADAANGTVAGKAGTAIYLLNCTTGSNPQGYIVNSVSLDLGANVLGSIEAAVYNANVTARLCTVAAGQAAVGGLNTLPLTGLNCNDPDNTGNDGVGLSPNTTYKIALAFSNLLDMRLTTAGSDCTVGAPGAEFMHFRGYNSSPTVTFPRSSAGNQPWATKCAFRLYLNLTPAGGPTPTPSVSVAVSPSSAGVWTGATQQFTASVTGTSNATVNWKANAGTISSSGLYTAPQSAGTYTVTATSMADSSKSGSAQVTAMTPPASVGITLSPSASTLQVGANQQFTASVSGTSNTTVTWKATAGTITTAGLYTAPQAAGTYTVTATSVADATKSASALVLVNAPPSVASVSVSPSSASMPTGASQQFAASVTGTTNTAVRWKTTGGTISSSGMYSAPQTAGTYTVMATSVADATKSASSLVTVTAPLPGGMATYAGNGAGCPINTVPGGPTDLVTSYNCPMPNPTGSGNLLLMWVRFNNANSPNLTFSTNQGPLLATQAVSCLDNPNNQTESRLYYVANAPAGINVVTVNFSQNSSYVQLQPYEFYNVDTTAPLDQAVCQVSSGSSISSGVLPDLSASGDLVVHFGFADNGAAISSCTPGSQSNITWKMRAALIAGPEPMCFQYGNYNSTTSFSPTMTFGTSVSYVSLSAAFKAANAGTPPASGIRVVYVQHDDGYSQGASSLKFQLPISGNLAVEMTSAGCLSNTLSSCPYPTAFSDGTNTWKLVSGVHYVSSTGASQETVGSNWYASNVTPGYYTLNITQHGCTGGCAPFPDSYIMFDIAGASANPLDLGFGGAGNGLVSISNTSSTSAPVTTFTATPSAANEVILAQAGYEWDSFTGLTSPNGAQFLSAYYTGETNYSWCDLNGGWGLLYNGSSTAPVTWTWGHDSSQYPGAGRGLALGVAFR